MDDLHLKLCPSHIKCKWHFDQFQVLKDPVNRINIKGVFLHDKTISLTGHFLQMQSLF